MIIFISKCIFIFDKFERSKITSVIFPYDVYLEITCDIAILKSSLIYVCSCDNLNSKELKSNINKILKVRNMKTRLCMSFSNNYKKKN